MSLVGAVLLLAGAVLALAGVIAFGLWLWANHSQLDALSDEEIAARLAPCVAAELIVMQSQHDEGAVE